ncbi:Alpha/Beta hydrolase protein [Mycena maculata]|uniref:Alpha/Beta hydrolase protein n=1 Tax=Mycena maculata TaxID=230809 RepID=A0AAD7J030_9AGAR|nr:Alpha/Beta hydrolase protein [Mycena maculata]
MQSHVTLPPANMAESPFTISVPAEQLEALKQKLELTRFPDELDDAGWAYGAPLADIKRLVSRWKDGYDWRKHEAMLNAELPQFTRDILVDGFGTLNVHYVHKRSTLESAIPLLFVHGWPGSFIEARKITPLLTQVHPDQPSFHVVALSLPGYGFSEAPSKKGFRLAQYAEISNKLMLALGYNEYVTQGGDWGSMITRKVAAIYGGKHSKAWHTNFPLIRPPAFSSNPLRLISALSMLLSLLWLSPEEKSGLERSEETRRSGLGYFNEQATKPQTLGYSLTDSPAGLLAWIYEKLVAWTDKYPWDDDEVLTWISLYWFSRAGPAASLRIYYEVSSEDSVLPPSHAAHPTIPLGFSYFPGELFNVPRSWTRRTGNVVFEAQHALGGHFAAHEVPDILVGDLRKMFGRGGPAHGVVPGQSGY